MDFFLIKPDAYQKKLRDVILEEIKKYYTVREIFTVLLSVENLKTIYPSPVAFHLARWYGFCDRALEVIIVDGDDISESKSHKLKYLLRKKYDWKHFLNAIPGVRVGSLLHSPDERDRDVQLGTLRSATFEDLNASSNFFLIKPDAHTLGIVESIIDQIKKYFVVRSRYYSSVGMVNAYFFYASFRSGFASFRSGVLGSMLLFMRRSVFPATRFSLLVVEVEPRRNGYEVAHELKYSIRQMYDPSSMLSRIIPWFRPGGLVHTPNPREAAEQLSMLRRWKNL